MANITSISGMRDYIKSQLGHPVITVEISDDQLDWIISDTAEIINRYMYGEASHKDFVSITLSAGQKEYNLSGENVNDAIDILLTSTIDGGINSLFTPSNVILGGNSDIIHNISEFQLMDYEMAMMYLKLIDNEFAVKYRIDYIQSQQKLLILPTPDQDLTGYLEVYKKETAENLYNNILFKKLCIAEAKILWGSILSKYSVQLPGGGTVNGDAIKSDGKEEKEKIMERVESEGEPIDFFIG